MKKHIKIITKMADFNTSEYIFDWNKINIDNPSSIFVGYFKSQKLVGLICFIRHPEDGFRFNEIVDLEVLEKKSWLIYWVKVTSICHA